ncbi:MAG: NAD(+) diphosphatase [Anaerolineae bacterium]
MTASFVSSTTPAAPNPAPAYWFIHRGFRLLVRLEEDWASLPRVVDPSELGLTVVRRQYLGYFDNTIPEFCYSAEVDRNAEAPEGMTFIGLRRLYGLLDEALFAVAGRAVQIVDWDRNHQFCGHCGVRTEALEGERAKQCPNCGLTNYPRISPAMIVRVDRFSERGPELLLARASYFPPNLFSVLAGFVEPGETLEECVQREICEETNIRVKNIRYFGSQPWPFPNSLMIAFTAEYAGGEIRVDDTEIKEAGWFTADALPQVPASLSIARRLIDDFVAQYGS